MNDVPSQKASLRTLLLQRRERLSPEAVHRKSEAIRQRLFALDEFRAAGLIHFFIAIGREVETLPMIQEAITLQKRVVVPVVVPESMDMRLSELLKDSPLVQGVRGTLQPSPDQIRPINTSEIDLMLVPGMAFDRHGHRLGRGSGYFDRLLGQSFKKSMPIIALAYELQLVEHIPVMDHDKKVDKIITEERVIDC
ncbi:MAG TPA: 5-formyltetrahydrofolate cyclo-ligase [Nitrospiria bacterium]|nr:5-formyltetrahydrofolate cyclo-ligase [Nitrospiria bacterium]